MLRSIIGAGLTALLLAPSVHAVESKTLGIYPAGQSNSPEPWLKYQLRPGEVAYGSVTIENRSASTQALLIYPVDAAPNGDGGFGMQPQSAPRTDTGGWITLAQSTLQLSAHSQRTVSFLLNTPTTTYIGPHYAGIVIQEAAQPKPRGGGMNITTITRLGVRLYATIVGEARPDLGISRITTELHGNQLSLYINLRNTGNTLLTPSGQIRHQSLIGGRQLHDFHAGRALKPRGDVTVATRSRIRLPWLPQRHIIAVQLSYGEPGNMRVASAHAAVWTGHPLRWLYAITAMLAGLLLTVMVRAWLNQRTRPN